MRVKRTTQERVSALEFQLYFLADQREYYKFQPDRYKAIAGVLRVLVATGSPKSFHPLLLDLMDEFDYVHEVQPPSEPFPRPIILVSELGQRIALEELDVDEMTPEALEAHMEALREEDRARMRPIPLREYISDGLAMYIAPKWFSNNELIRTIAEQFGLGHEDPSIDQEIAQSMLFKIDGVQSHILLLIGISDLVLRAGIDFLEYLARNHDVELTYFQLVHSEEPS